LFSRTVHFRVKLLIRIKFVRFHGCS
jgi:hypothetical protein